MAKSDDEIDVYDLLRQADELLQDDQDDDFPDETDDFTPEFEESMDLDDTMIYRNAANHYGQLESKSSSAPPPLQPSAGRSAQRPAQKPTQAEKAVSSFKAYNSDFRNSHSSYQKSTDETAVIPNFSHKAAASQTAPPSQQDQTSRPRRKRRGCLTPVMMLLSLILVCVLGFHLLVRPPKTDQPIGPRKSGASTVLLCGADEGGVRTDTMMLLYTDGHRSGLLTLPRDTFTRTAYGLDVKLNSAYGRNDGGVEGMEVLLNYVQDIIGYRPDGYILMELPTLEGLIDLMGGVDFNVAQDLTFDNGELIVTLEQGMQHLNGHDAMGLLRFRYGYYNQDLGRQDVQKDFLKACLSQWLQPSNLPKIKDLLSLFQLETLTNLSTSNFVWFGLNLLKSGFSDISTDTLPGYATMIGDQSFYVLYPNEVASMVQNSYNPYKVEITSDMLRIVTE